MIKISGEELSKIAQFVAGVDDMISGKFILADVKINKVLNMIAQSDELYRYITECMTGFDFSREFHRAEAKNGLNGGAFVVPNEPEKLIAFVFCLFVECDAKRIDFYNFINENFGGATKSDAYKNFASKMLVPFKEIVASHFGMAQVSGNQMEQMTSAFRRDLQSEPLFDNTPANDDEMYASAQFEQEERTATSQNVDYATHNFDGATNDFDYETNNFDDATRNFDEGAFAKGNITNSKTFEQESLTNNAGNATQPANDPWQEICKICSNVESSIYTERKIKDYLKQELLYIVGTIKYSTKYRDLKIISALVTAFDELTQKFKSVQFVFGELKSKIAEMYQK